METSSTQPPQSESRQEVVAPIPSPAKPTTLHISDRAALAAAWRTRHPILTHLNADTTWVLHLPYPEGVTRPPGRSRFNVLLDPWLQGPQSDGGRWFSIQWHVVAPSVQTIKELNGLLCELERGIAPPREAETAEQGAETDPYIDVVAISHEFTDHCHEATLHELPSSTPIFAPDKAAKLIRSWKHFNAVIEVPPFLATGTSDWRKALSCAPLPPWVGVGRVVTLGNALYYHSALIVAWTNSASGEEASSIIYSPHGIEASALEGIRNTGLRTLALLHGLDDVRLWMIKQLNLGAINGVAAARRCGAKYWVATHDEVKKGGGFISLLLRRTSWSVTEAAEKEGEKDTGKRTEDDEQVAGYKFVELGSGDGLVLA
ncbi:hypothetical protein GQX73_g119 [Xylaria multiplex]|uniref:Metallo-beta-lactamase domain-containing protein n=1 Tax=Xylaria multiplex TaxID=323545 RepID=A0A7C8IVT7_9PEZI|nr:hypothetical protein GQX73_g119 [Xylaria multiplex]